MRLGYPYSDKVCDGSTDVPNSVQGDITSVKGVDDATIRAHSGLTSSGDIRLRARVILDNVTSRAHSGGQIRMRERLRHMVRCREDWRVWRHVGGGVVAIDTSLRHWGAICHIHWCLLIPVLHKRGTPRTLNCHWRIVTDFCLRNDSPVGQPHYLLHPRRCFDTLSVGTGVVAGHKLLVLHLSFLPGAQAGA